MTDDPRLDPRRKLVCVSCGEWILAHNYDDAWYCDRCGGSMIETYTDSAFLNLDLAMKGTGRAIADLLSAISRKWRSTDA